MLAEGDVRVGVDEGEVVVEVGPHVVALVEVNGRDAVVALVLVLNLCIRECRIVPFLRYPVTGLSADNLTG